MVIVFYTSSHGFGHATRDVEIIHALARLQPTAHIAVRTLAPAWLFEGEVQQVEVDTGIAQLDSLRVDPDETARRAAVFYASFEGRVAEEAARLRDLGASIVVSDVPPLAFAAARRAGVPSVAIANFTWDWIYEDYPAFDRLAPGVIDTIRRAYRLATAALRLPLHGGFEPMAAVMRDIPLVARRSHRGREETRRLLGLTGNRPVVLASFGGHELSVPYERVARDSCFTLVVTEHERPEEHRGRARHAKRIVSSELRAAGLGYEDLVAAADVVVGKPGYGIVSECIANGAALLYAPRGPFREHDLFVREMPEVLRCREIAVEDLVEGRWDAAVTSLLQQPAPSRQMGTNGADVAARALMDIAR